MNEGHPNFVRLPDALFEKNKYGAPLAGRWRRLGAQLIDFAIVLAVVFPIQTLRGAIPAENPMALSYQAVATAFACGVWVMVNGFYLSTYGQTLGKRMLKIRIVRSSGEPASFVRLAVVRYILFGVLNIIPVVGPFIGFADTVSIFRSEKRCLHDLLADTVVVDIRCSLRA
jgi:uncharacterized RDD family membrane protein YckC